MAEHQVGTQSIKIVALPARIIWPLSHKSKEPTIDQFAFRMHGIDSKKNYTLVETLSPL
jgi:hypothetical protein